MMRTIYELPATEFINGDQLDPVRSAVFLFACNLTGFAAPAGGLVY